MENIFMIIYFLGRIESWIIFTERKNGGLVFESSNCKKNEVVWLHFFEKWNSLK